MRKSLMIFVLWFVASAANAAYLTLDDSSSKQWEYHPTNEAYSFTFHYQVNSSVSMTLRCQPLIENAEFTLLIDGEKRKVVRIFGYDHRTDLAQSMDLTLEGFVYGDFAHIFAQYETIWLIGEDGREIVTFDNQNRMAANELFSFRKQCRLVVPSKK